MNKMEVEISEFLSSSNPDMLRENANKDAKLVHTHRDLLAGIVSRNQFEKDIPADILKAHKDGYIHVHDTDYWISNLTNCCLVNYPEMLKTGFKIGSAELSEPKSIGVACTVLSQIVLAVSSSQYGGQTLAHIDKHLERYVQKSYDKLLVKQKKYNLPDSFVEDEIRKEVKDSLQTLLYQINTLTSCNGQSPFITLSLGTSTTKFGRMITEEYLRVHMKGLGEEGTTPIFPKVIFFLQDGLNLKKGDINYDLKQLAMECTAKRIYPDYVSIPKNLECTGSSSEPVSPMGCRSYLGKWVNSEGNEQYMGRFNIGVCSVSLPMIALESSDYSDFKNKLKHYMTLCYNAHNERVKRLKKTKAKTNPVLFCEGALARLDPEETLESILMDGRCSISIGYVGLNECCKFLFGEYDKSFATAIMKFMKDVLVEFSCESSLPFSLYGSPAESLCYKFAKCINEKYDNVLQKDYITNSFHVPVNEQITAFDKIDAESGFANISSGGNITYVETPKMNNNMTGLEAIIDYAYEHVQYFGINIPVDVCYCCKFEGAFIPSIDGFTCPVCKNSNPEKMMCIRRVSGYLGSATRPFNYGKQNEVCERIIHEQRRTKS